MVYQRLVVVKLALCNHDLCFRRLGLVLRLLLASRVFSHFYTRDHLACFDGIALAHQDRLHAAARQLAQQLPAHLTTADREALQRWLMMAYDEPEIIAQSEPSGFKYEIHGWRPAYQQAFYDLNAAWIKRYFTLEPEDEKMLSDPEGYIVRPGGRLLFALVNGEVVGTCALIPEGPGHYELAKMTVAEAFEGHGIGRRLCEAALGVARGLGATQVDLVSQRGLGRALHVYQRLGFREVPLTAIDRERYQRCDIRMALPLT